MKMRHDFHFINSGFDILEQTKCNIHVKIARYMRRKPFEGMKQPTPFGGHLGFQVIAEIECEDSSIKTLQYSLKDSESEIQSGTINTKDNLILQIYDSRNYVLEINEDTKSCNILSDKS